MNDMKAPNYNCKYFESKNILFDETHKCVTDEGSQVKVGIFQFFGFHIKRHAS